MMEKTLTENHVKKFKEKLKENEKSDNTIEKYTRDVKKLIKYLDGRPVTKDELISFKESLMQDHKPATVNAAVTAVNLFLNFTGQNDLNLKHVRQQQKMFYSEDRELTDREYSRLIEVAWQINKRIYYIMLTLVGTGIRVGELKFFTVEAVLQGKVEVNHKGKSSIVVIPSDVKRALLDYCKQNGILSGIIFRSQKGNPLDRRIIWADMKKLCEIAKVDPKKVFPHNFRRLFAKIFFHAKKDIVKLAALLGHKSIETTRIYLMESVKEITRVLDKIKIVPKYLKYTE